MDTGLLQSICGQLHVAGQFCVFCLPLLQFGTFGLQLRLLGKDRLEPFTIVFTIAGGRSYEGGIENSFAAQNIHYTQYITEHDDWRLVDIYADEGITGTSVEKREDFKRMLADSERGLIDRILVKSISRFARNTVDCLNYVRMLKAQGIAVYFEKENINSMDESTELMLTMMGAFAQAESESISGNIQAGKRYAMQRGEATINYHNLYAYEKGPDGKPRAIPEQAEIVREIYQKYLRGDSLNMIRKDLEERHIPNARGGVTWTHTAVRGILSNEKYAGDVLMQKTFRQDCISRKTIRNTGQRAMYLVQNNHEAIIDRKTYDAVQTELTRRNALKGNTQKSTPSGRSCYTPKYALSDRVICGECGTLYRRCTWVNRGKKHIVWRCISRFDYGKKYCHDSPAVDEQQLQQAILRVINGAMSEKPALVRQVTENLQVVIRPSRSEELTVAEIDRELEALAREFSNTAFCPRDSFLFQARENPWRHRRTLPAQWQFQSGLSVSRSQF